MLSERLKNRCVSAKSTGVASVKGYEIDFYKKSIDGSGKASLVKRDNVNKRLYGVLFEIDCDDSKSLDGFEDYARERKNGYYRVDDFLVMSGCEEF